MGGSVQPEQRFKEIAEAYGVLSDPAACRATRM